MSKLEFNPEWVETARRGDQDAVSMLYSSTYSSVYYTIRSLVRYDEDTVMDLLQDTYVKAFTKLDSLGADDKFPAWVKTIARNTALNYLDKKKPLLFTETEDDEGNATWEPVDTDMSRIPEEVLDQADTEQIFKEILDSIPEKQRIVISMYYYMEIKQADIARILGLSIGAVNTRLKLGVKSIEEKILAIEKRDGIRLHAIAPFAFFLFMLKKVDAKAMEPDMDILSHVMDTIKNGDSSNYNTGDSRSPSSGEIGQDTDISSSAEKAAKAAGSTAAKGTVAKVIGGIAIVAVVGGGSVYISSTITNNNEDTAKMESTSETGDGTSESDLQAAYEAYAELYKEIEDEYGTLDTVNHVFEYYSDSFALGVFFADLIDFDENGIPELVIAYGRKPNNDEQYPIYYCQVFTWNGGQVVQVNQDNVIIGGGDPSGTCVMTAEYDGSPYILYGEIRAFDHIEFKTWNGTDFITVKTFDNSYYDDYYSYNFMVDGIEVTEDEYTQEYEDWMSQTQTYSPWEMAHEYYGYEGASAMVDNAETTIAETKEILGLESAQEASLSKWQEAYIDYINEHRGTDYYRGNALETYKLVNINDDNIPELYISYGTTAGGDVICTYSDDKVIDQTMWIKGFSYIEGQNIFRDTGGHMDTYHDKIYSIENGQFVLLHGGNSGAATDESIEYDANGYPIFHYYWDATEVSSETEYENLLNEVYDTQQAISPFDGTEFDSETGRDIGNGLCDYGEIIELIAKYK